MKKCSKCMQVKSVGDFGKNNLRNDGMQPYCLECKRVVDRKYYHSNSKRRKNLKTYQTNCRKRNKEYIWKYLTTHPCVDCGEVDPVVLEFDHVRGKKLKSISKMAMGHNSLESIEEEIKKCDVRCANCHRRKTAKQMGWFQSYDLDGR